MSKWVWQKGLAAVGAISALIAACSSNSETAGSTLETENSVAVTVQYADGRVAARTSVYVRPDNFLAGASSRAVDDNNVAVADTSAGIFNFETNEQGQVALPKMKSGHYVVEARGESQKAISKIAVVDSVCEPFTMEMTQVGSMNGQVLLPQGVKSVTVGIRGLDYVVETDSLGNFEFPSLPEGDFSAVGFIYSTREYQYGNGDVDRFDNVELLGVTEVKVESAELVKDVSIGARPQVPVQDTTAKDSVDQDTVESLPYLMLADFEDSTYGWYTSFSRNATADLTAEKAGGKYGLVAHLQCHKDSNVVWTMMGHNFRKFNDFSTLDSVVLWARGANDADDSMWVSVSFDVHVDNSSADSVLGYETGKAWAHMPLDHDGEWTRIVVTPKRLEPTDSNKIGGNLGWNAVKDHINSIGIFAGTSQHKGDYELWVDDIEIFGVKDIK